MNARHISALLAFLLVCGLGAYAWAHPHIFIDSRITLIFDEKGLVAIQEEWVFDEMFGQFILEDYDANKNKKLEPAEGKKIKAEAFDNLKDHGYFHIVKLNGKPFTVKTVTDFSVAMVKGRVAYRFTTPCRKAIDKTPLDIYFSLSDPTVYTDLLFTKDSPLSGGAAAEKYTVTHKLDDGVQPSGQVLAQSLLIKVKRK